MKRVLSSACDREKYGQIVFIFLQRNVCALSLFPRSHISPYSKEAALVLNRKVDELEINGDIILFFLFFYFLLKIIISIIYTNICIYYLCLFSTQIFKHYLIKIYLRKKYNWILSLVFLKKQSNSYEFILKNKKY